MFFLGILFEWLFFAVYCYRNMNKDLYSAFFSIFFHGSTIPFHFKWLISSETTKAPHSIYHSLDDTDDILMNLVHRCVFDFKIKVWKSFDTSLLAVMVCICVKNITRQLKSFLFLYSFFSILFFGLNNKWCK